MKKFFTKGQHYWRNVLTRIMLIIITVGLIVLFLPRKEAKLFSNYKVNSAWSNGTVIAKEEFSIMKPKSVVNAEKDSIKAKYQPYYNLRSDIESRKISEFLSKYQNGIPGMPHEIVGLIAKKLHQIYQRGIIDPIQYTNLTADTSKMIHVVVGKQTTLVSPDSLLTTMGAYEQIFLDPQLGPNREALQSCNLNEFIEPNLIYDKSRNKMELDASLRGVATAMGSIMEGQRIIGDGDIVSYRDSLTIDSYEKTLIAERNSSAKELRTKTIGQVIYVFMLVVIFTMYLGLFRKDYFEKPRSVAMLYSLIVIFPIITSLMMRHPMFTVFILPFAMTPIFIRVFMDSRTAFIAHVTMVLLCAAAVTRQYEFIIVQIVGGLIAIYSLRELSKRSQIFITAIYVTIGTTLVYFALQLIQTSKITILGDEIFIHLIIAGIFLLFTYPLMLIIEKTFGFISSVSLFELSNTNNTLLRRLSQEAPGTFQHSVTVGNLAAEVANKIGAKSQLVRTGALYHDIGKIETPVFFTENQSGVNPHDSISDIESAKIIISHVTKGLKLAEQYNLPQEIKDFISTHHGTGLTKYFYIHYKNEHPEEDVDKNLFRYPGPNPFTREQAILMICDTVEAASRSLKEYTEESISRLVNQLIDGQVAEGFFNDCPITFLDIKRTKKVLIERLKAIYHTRIQYPKLNA